MVKLQVCCLIIIVFIMGIYFSAKRMRSTEHDVFVALLFSSLLNLCFDIATVYTVNHLDEVPAVVNRILHNCFIVSISIVIYLMFLYITYLVCQEKVIFAGKYRWVKYPPILPIIFMCILPMSYTQTPNGNYSSGPAPIVTYCVIAYYFVLSIVLLWHYRAIINHKKRMIIITALTIEGIASVCQAIFNHLLVSGFGITMLCLALFVTVENPDFHLMERLREERKKAQEANSAKTVFLASMSHEIRTPINGVIGMNEMILREANQSDIRGYALHIKAAAQTLLSIISDIMDLSKIESGKMELCPVEYELNSLLKDVYYIILERVKEKNLKLDIYVDNELPSVLYGDDVRLRQILMNLLTNAVKYTEKGSITVTVSEKARRNGIVTLDFAVKDTGMGIKEENISKLFTAFERIDEIKNRKIEGIGLGLALTQQFLDMMKSKLQVESEYGKGSTFSFSIEQMIVNEQAVGNFDEQIKLQINSFVYQSRIYAPKANILLVDDNDINRKVFVSLLKESGIQITQAASGKECLEWFKKKSFDMIFLDHMMPDMDGIETYRVMKTLDNNINKKTPVIMLTANAVSGAKEQYRLMGFDGFLSKPIKSDKLERMIQDLLPKELLEEKPLDAVGIENETGIFDIKDEQDTFELPYIDGIDWEYAKIHIESSEMIWSVTQDFVRRMEEERSSLNALAAGIDTPEGLRLFQTKVHALKSAAALIGILTIASFARTLEYAAQDKRTDKIRALLPFLNEEMLEYERRLLPMLEREEPEEKEKMENRPIILAMLEMVRLAFMDIDVDAADAAMEQLNMYSYEEGLQKQIDELGHLVYDMKAEEAEKLINGIIETLG